MATSAEAIERYGRFSDALDILKSLGVVSEDSRLQGLEATRDALRKRIPEILASREDQPGDPLGEFFRSLAGAMSSLLALDAGIPMSAFRYAFNPGMFSEQALIRYIRLLRESNLEVEERLDRIEFLATRLLSTEQQDGSLMLRPEGEVTAILELAVGSGSALDEAESAKVVAELEGALTAIRVFSQFDDLFGSSVYQNLLAFKRKLGPGMLDPRVLVAAAKVNVAITNHVRKTKSPAAAVSSARVPESTDVSRQFEAFRAELEEEDTPPGSVEPVLRSHADQALVAWDSYLTFTTAVDILLMLAAHADNERLDELEQRRRSVRKAARALREEEDSQQKLNELAEQLGAAQQELLALDASIPMEVYRRRLNPRIFKNEVVTRFVRLLVQGVEDHPERLDRIEYLVTRLLSSESPSGKLEMRPRAEAIVLLEAVAGKYKAESDVRGEAMARLAEASDRVDSLENSEDLFEDGLYRALYEYKRSLGPSVLDAEILYEVVSLNIRISNRFDVTYQTSEGRVPLPGFRFDDTEAGRRFTEQREGGANPGDGETSK